MHTVLMVVKDLRAYCTQATKFKRLADSGESKADRATYSSQLTSLAYELLYSFGDVTLEKVSK